jgi:hypothetical protein
MRALNAMREELGEGAYAWLWAALQDHNPSLIEIVARCIVDQSAQDKGPPYWLRMLEEQHYRLRCNMRSPDLDEPVHGSFD